MAEARERILVPRQFNVSAVCRRNSATLLCRAVDFRNFCPIRQREIPRVQCDLAGFSNFDSP